MMAARNGKRSMLSDEPLNDCEQSISQQASMSLDRAKECDLVHTYPDIFENWARLLKCRLASIQD